jgi:hypothetical protein
MGHWCWVLRLPALMPSSTSFQTPWSDDVLVDSAQCSWPLSHLLELLTATVIIAADNVLFDSAHSSWAVAEPSACAAAVVTADDTVLPYAAAIISVFQSISKICPGSLVGCCYPLEVCRLRFTGNRRRRGLYGYRYGKVMFIQSYLSSFLLEKGHG